MTKGGGKTIDNYWCKYFAHYIDYNFARATGPGIGKYPRNPNISLHRIVRLELSEMWKRCLDGEKVTYCLFCLFNCETQKMFNFNIFCGGSTAQLSPKSANIHGILEFTSTELYARKCRKCDQDAWVVLRFFVACIVLLIMRHRKSLSPTRFMTEAIQSYLFYATLFLAGRLNLEWSWFGIWNWWKCRLNKHFSRCQRLQNRRISNESLYLPWCNCTYVGVGDANRMLALFWSCLLLVLPCQ